MRHDRPRARPRPRILDGSPRSRARVLGRSENAAIVADDATASSDSGRAIVDRVHESRGQSVCRRACGPRGRAIDDTCLHELSAWSADLAALGEHGHNRALEPSPGALRSMPTPAHVREAWPAYGGRVDARYSEALADRLRPMWRRAGLAAASASSTFQVHRLQPRSRSAGRSPTNAGCHAALRPADGRRDQST